MNGHKIIVGIAGTLIGGLLIAFIVREVRLNHANHEYILREELQHR